MNAEIVGGLIGLCVGGVLVYILTNTCWLGLWHIRIDNRPCLLCGK